MFNQLKKIIASNEMLLKNIIGAFVVKGGSLIISVVLLPLYLRFFGDQTVLGIWYTILSILNWVVLFDLGLGQGLRNQLPVFIEKNNQKGIRDSISTTYILMSIIAIVIGIAGYACIPLADWNNIFNVSSSLVENFILVKCVRIVFIGIMLQIVLKIITSILYAYQRSAIVNALALFTNILILLFLLVLPSKSISENLLMMSWVNVVAANVPYIICSIVVFSTMLKGKVPSFKCFNKNYIKQICNVGIALLWLQIVFMVVSSANEFLISNFTAPEYVVEYQAYFKIFKTAAMIISLALTPVWSAVTKAQAQKNYVWILKIYRVFLILTLACFVAELLIVPFLGVVFDIWLGTGVIHANIVYGLVFVCSSVVFVAHNVNTTIGNGMSYFKLQMIWMTFAGIIFIPLAYIFVQMTRSWIAVVLANVLAMLPYEVLAPIFTIKKLKNKIEE